MAGDLMCNVWEKAEPNRFRDYYQTKVKKGMKRIRADLPLPEREELYTTSSKTFEPEVGVMMTISKIKHKYVHIGKSSSSIVFLPIALAHSIITNARKVIFLYENMFNHEAADKATH